GEDQLKAVSYVEETYAGESETITVILDNQNRDLTIETPKHGEKINRETIIVEGTVHDKQFDAVEEHGQKAEINGNSNSQRVLLENGENEIEVVTKDKVGNVTNETVTVDVNYHSPNIKNLSPSEDVFINSGESVKIEFDSELGQRAVFMIQMP